MSQDAFLGLQDKNATKKSRLLFPRYHSFLGSMGLLLTQQQYLKSEEASSEEDVQDEEDLPPKPQDPQEPPNIIQEPPTME